MSGFTPELFASKLAKLSDSQQSIETLSHWVQFHKKASSQTASAWAAETLRAPPKRQLVFVYLANDILQNSRRKGPEFVNAFAPHCVTVLPKVHTAADATVKQKIVRLIGIWEERQVLPPTTLADIRTRIGGGSGSAGGPGTSTSSGGSSSGNGGGHGGGGTKRPREPPSAPPVEEEEDDEYVPTSMSGGGIAAASIAAAQSGSASGGPGGAGGSMALADLLESFDEGSLVDELQAERDADLDLAALEDVTVTDPSDLAAAKAKAESASRLLASQQERIESELASRQKLILLLAASVEQQNAQCAKLRAAQKALAEIMGTAAMAKADVENMEQQMASIAAAAAEAM